VCAASAQAQGSGYLSGAFVLEGAADLDHTALQNFVRFNEGERTGQTGVDDDGNQFVDDVSGWNFASNDGTFFPERTKVFFRDNQVKLREVLALYSAMEKGNPLAANRFAMDRSLQRAADIALNLSHATHVAGIIASSSQGSARIQNMNMFVPSQESTPAPALAPGGLPLRGLMRADLQLGPADLEGEPGEVPPAQTGSVFDDKTSFAPKVIVLRAQTSMLARRITEFLHLSGTGVVNASLGWDRSNVGMGYERIWLQELLSKGLPPDTQRTNAQEAVFQKAVTTELGAWKDFWKQIANNNPNTLFVVAAGNSGLKGPTFANNDQTEVFPGNLSRDFANVLTVAAVDSKGVLTDFSSYGHLNVNIGALGKAVDSLAPGDLRLTMSGTSMAAPFVAGVATKVRETNPALLAPQVRLLIEQTGLTAGSLQGKTTTGRSIDTATAVRAAGLSLSQNLASAINDAVNARPAATIARNGRPGLGILIGLPAAREATDGFAGGAVPDGTQGKVSRTSDGVRESMLRRERLALGLF